uniref:Uncharacterized protein n=1 Tax=Lactuca sativa TaxID=4236 RepID=A0A9R1WKR8_LACSA|nr:hypothetical protein LSAT_V11C200080180 [Lactuca sativa]
MEKRAAVVVSIQGGRQGRKGHARRRIWLWDRLQQPLAMAFIVVHQPPPYGGYRKHKCRYHRLTVRVSVSDSSDTCIYFEDFIFKIPNQEPILEARATLLWLDKNYRPTRIPPEVRSKLVQFVLHDKVEWFHFYGVK